MSDDEKWMNRALELSERGRGWVEPNPMVGAVVVCAGEVVGEGWHQRYGEAHAEVNALADAGERARGATLYVTLEPCCHHGKTPPCTDAVLRSGMRRVVIALPDPFPPVAGQGMAILENAGLAVEVGPGQRAARQLCAPYLKLLATGRPYVHAKWAMTLDGKIATRTGDSRWISNEASRQHVHQLRGRMDAIVVGIGTVLADDPLLTARPPGPRTPSRVVLDSRGRMPPTNQLARTAKNIPTMIATSQAPPERATALTSAGCELLVLPEKEGRVALGALLDELGRRRMTNVLVEGGAEVLGRFLDTGELDEIHVFIAPRLAGGTGAKTALGGKGIERIADALKFSRIEVKELDGDLYVHGWH